MIPLELLPPPLFPAERLVLLSALIPSLAEPRAWDARYEIEAYVWRCKAAGFCETPDQVRLCVERWLAGKRAVTPPGAARRKREDAQRAEALKAPPAELVTAVEAAISEQAKAAAQYRQGAEKALNALVGAVMKRCRADPAIIKALLAKSLS